jgi:phage tail protein X
MANLFEEYRTQQGDMVDLIAFRRFGASSPHAERILDANPGLAAYGDVLPPNIIVKIPVPKVQDRKTVTRLWD